MLCDQFNARLQNLLDARKSPERDSALQQHAQQCPDCHAQLTSLTRLLEGLDLLDVPALPDDFAQRVVQQVSGPCRRSTPTTGALVSMALAATLVIAVVPMSWYLSRRSQPSAPSPQNVGAPRDELGQPFAVAQTPDQTAEEEGWLVPGASILELYPAEVRQRHREQVNQIADDLRPIATPFNAAMTAIRRSMPIRHSSPAKGEPRTSLQRSRHAQHLS